MAKKITGYVKLQIPAGKATPAPPVGPALGQHGVNIMDFCKAFNARTQKLQGTDHPGGDHGLHRPLLHLHHQDAAGVDPAAAGRGHRQGLRRAQPNKVGKVTRAQVEEIAKTKMPDLNATSLEAAIRIVEGTARSMGIEVVA